MRDDSRRAGDRTSDADLPREPIGTGGLPAEADLIEIVLASRGSTSSGGADEPQEFHELDAESRARAVELRAFLDGCRAAVVDDAAGQTAADQVSGGGPEGVSGAADDARSSALVERVLAATTREDLSWRGDLRLVGGFVVDRLRSSRMLRIAAVVLAMHFVGLSVLAYHILRQPTEPYINVDFEYPPVPIFPEEVAEPGVELTLPEAGEEPRVRELPPGEPGEHRDR